MTHFSHFLKYLPTFSPVLPSDIAQLPTDSAEDPALEFEEIRPVPWSDWLESRVQQDKQTLEGKKRHEYQIGFFKVVTAGR